MNIVNKIIRTKKNYIDFNFIKTKMDEIKYMVIYMDNSCEVHFNNANDGESSRMIVSPCGSEFVYRTYSDNNIKSKLYLFLNHKSYVSLII